MDSRLDPQFGELVELIERKEKISPRKSLWIAWQCQIALVETVFVKFVQGHTDFARRFVMIDDRERNDHAAAPIAHVPEIYVKPFSNEQNFRRNCGQIFPRKKSEQRK